MELPDFFGLDLGNHSIKVAEVKRSGERSARLLHIGGVSTEVSLLTDESEAGIARIAEQINRAREMAGITTPNCVAAVPESPVFSRLLTVPKVREDQLRDTVHWELKPLIPVPLEGVDIAFLQIAEKQVGEQTMVDVYAVAAPKTLTDKFKKIADKAKLNLIALETESLANTRVVAFNYVTDTDLMVCDLGGNATDLVLARNGVPVFSQTINTGSDAFTKAIATDFGLDIPQAEKYKHAFGLRTDQGEGKIARSIEPVMQIIINEMNRTVTYFKQRVTDASATKLYLCGDGAKLPGLPEYFQQKLGFEVVVVNPAQNLKLSGSVRKDVEQNAIVGFSVAIGLGLKNG